QGTIGSDDACSTTAEFPNTTKGAAITRRALHDSLHSDHSVQVRVPHELRDRQREALEIAVLTEHGRVRVRPCRELAVRIVDALCLPATEVTETEPAEEQVAHALLAQLRHQCVTAQIDGRLVADGAPRVDESERRTCRSCA